MADKDMKWKTLSQKYLIEKPWLTARVDKVELPTGAIIILRAGISRLGEHHRHHEGGNVRLRSPVSLCDR